MSGDVGLLRIETEVLSGSPELGLSAVYEMTILVVLQTVHEQLLVTFVTLIVEDEDTSQTAEDATLFVVSADVDVLI